MTSLPGWNGEFGVDFSAYPIPGTNCANCRSLQNTSPITCGSSKFIAASTPGKRAGDNVIPVSSGDPSKYCCNAWALSQDVAAGASSGATALAIGGVAVLVAGVVYLIYRTPSP